MWRNATWCDGMRQNMITRVLCLLWSTFRPVASRFPPYALATPTRPHELWTGWQLPAQTHVQWWGRATMLDFFCPQDLQSAQPLFLLLLLLLLLLQLLLCKKQNRATSNIMHWNPEIQRAPQYSVRTPRRALWRPLLFLCTALVHNASVTSYHSAPSTLCFPLTFIFSLWLVFCCTALSCSSLHFIFVVLVPASAAVGFSYTYINT